MKEVFAGVDKKELDSVKIEEITAAETFFFFLENGFLPWNKRIESIAELEQLLNADEELIIQLKKLILQKEKVAERLASQFSKRFMSKIIDAFLKDKKQEAEQFSAIQKDVKALHNNFLIPDQIWKHLIDEAVLIVFATDENINRELQFFSFLLTKIENNVALKSAISKIIEDLHIQPGIHKHLPDIIQGESRKEETRKSEIRVTESKKPVETIYIRNAGLVLLHPFLPALFEQLNLVRENSWIDEISQQKAVLVLEFLVTGKDEMEEFDLMLNKILCGIDLDEIVPTESNSDNEIKTECEELLANVITHWNVLKNTSIAGLREAFLQRSGKLSRVDDGWLLQVEQKSIDILLGHLPWGIGIIKLPWMIEMLYVEWA